MLQVPIDDGDQSPTECAGHKGAAKSAAATTCIPRLNKEL